MMSPDKMHELAQAMVDTASRASELRCCECGRVERETWGLKERGGKIYCELHLLDTPEKRAYEAWFVRDD